MSTYQSPSLTIYANASQPSPSLCFFYCASCPSLDLQAQPFFGSPGGIPSFGDVTSRPIHLASLLRTCQKLAMASLSKASFLALAFLFHVVYILSIFDIYFVSPIVSGMRLFPMERPPDGRAPADRLVLFVGTPP